jgi:succinate dehydrogenase / fumarate reductase, cytochrome b subunit
MRVMQLQKRLMAIAGVAMFVYLIWHMLTNLTFFSEVLFNDFYAWYNIGYIRYSVLTLFIVLIAAHVRTALKIRQVNAKARVIDYARHDGFKIPAKLVTLSVLFLLAFIVIHIIQTLLFDTFDPYQAMLDLFQSFFMLAFYMAGLFVLTMHLQHSLANVLQTLGKTDFTCQYLAWAVTLSVTGGFAIVPLYIYFGLS